MGLLERYRKFRQWRREPLRFEMSDTGHHCQNCGLDFTGNYCPCCGQRGGIGAVTWSSVRESVMELWGVGTRSMPYTLWNLLWRPGYLIDEYISGRRQVSFPPVKMLVFTAMIVFVLDHLLHLHVFGADSEPSTAAVESFIDRAVNWLENHYDWSMLFQFSLLILPTSIAFRNSPRHTRHTLPQGFFIQVFNSTLFLMLLAIWAVVRRAILLGGDNDDLGIAGFLVIAIVQVVVVYRHVFGYSLWGTLWRMATLVPMMVLEITLLLALGSLFFEEHSTLTYFFFGALFVLGTLFTWVARVVFSKRQAATRRQRRRQKAAMWTLWGALTLSVLALLRIFYMLVTGKMLLKATTEAEMHKGVGMAAVACFLLLVFLLFTGYMIRRLNKKMKTAQADASVPVS